MGAWRFKMVMLLTAQLAVVACAGRVVEVSGERADTSVEVARDADDADRGEALPAAPCPLEPPRPGSPCSTDVGAWIRCSYGDDVVPTCRVRFQCSLEKVWVDMGSCLRPPAGWCPSVSPKEGAACSYGGPWPCGYADGSLCDCVPASASDGDRWACIPPPPAPCPVVAPNAGTPCEPGLPPCQYGRKDRTGTPTSQPAYCVGGWWIWGEPFVSK